jgi:uncharacterized delta-60 repeat protein
VGSELVDSFRADISGQVLAIALQADGSVLVGGEFSSVAGYSPTNLARLHADGSVDEVFNPGADRSVGCIQVQPDGRILVAGIFDTLSGRPAPGIGLLNPDGTLDATFQAPTNTAIRCAVRDEQGRILISGVEGMYSNPTPFVRRLNASGTLDLSFNATIRGWPAAIACERGDTVLVAGTVIIPGGSGLRGVIRLRSNGSTDTSFVAPCPDAEIHTLVVQADGRILVGGIFFQLAGQPQQNLGRLNSDGSFDGGFRPVVNNSVDALALQRDGKLLLGGYYITQVNGNVRQGIARLLPAQPPSLGIQYENSTLLWPSLGSGPGTLSAIFDYSPDGLQWVPLGTATRVAKGWELRRVSVPVDGLVRARSPTAGGSGGTSVGWVQDFRGRPTLVKPLGDMTVGAGTTAVLSGLGMGSEPIAYQWFKNGQPLRDGGAFDGAQSGVLRVSSLLGGDAGLFHVVLSNALGVSTSAIVRLDVADPAISTHPESAKGVLGGAVSFGVSAHGTAPLDYQWIKDGLPIPGATQASLTLAKIDPQSPGRYWARVSTSFGTATSAPAVLTVNLATLDSGFAPETFARLNRFGVQPSGRIIASSDPYAGGSVWLELRRILPEGAPDPTFPMATNSLVDAFTLQLDGKILYGCHFSSNGWPFHLYRLRRLSENGVPEPGFDVECDDEIRGITT